MFLEDETPEYGVNVGVVEEGIEKARFFFENRVKSYQSYPSVVQAHSPSGTNKRTERAECTAHN